VNGNQKFGGRVPAAHRPGHPRTLRAAMLLRRLHGFLRSSVTCARTSSVCLLVRPFTLNILSGRRSLRALRHNHHPDPRFWQEGNAAQPLECRV